MRLLDRYLLRELLVPLGYCLGAFLILWVAVDLVAELNGFQSRKMLAGDVLQFYLVKTPEFLVLTMPMALLLAMLYALTNHARHYEITAMRSAGISLWRLSWPYLAVGFAASLASLALNELFVPGSMETAEQIRTRHLPATGPGPNKCVNTCFTNARDSRQWRIGTYDLKTGEMSEPVVSFRAPDGSGRLLKAERAVRTKGVWTFYDVRLYKEGELDTVILRTNVLAQPLFNETPDEIRSEIKISASLVNMMVRGYKKSEIPVAEILHYLRLQPHPVREAAIYTKLHGRLATPWTCFVVVLIAIPFGAASGRRNVFVGIAVSLLIFFGYYFLQQFCLALGASGTIPPSVAGWLPNGAFALVGLGLTAKVR